MERTRASAVAITNTADHLALSTVVEGAFVRGFWALQR